MDQRLGPRRAAGHVDVDRQELVRARDQRVVVEDAGARRAGAHRDHPLRLEHLVVDAADDRRHLDRDAAREDQHVGLARRRAEDLGAEARAVVARRDDRHHLDRAAGEAEGGGPERVRARPVERLLERRREHAAPRRTASRSAPSRSPRSRSRARSWRVRKSSRRRRRPTTFSRFISTRALLAATRTRTRPPAARRRQGLDRARRRPRPSGGRPPGRGRSTSTSKRMNSIAIR